MPRHIRRRSPLCGSEAAAPRLLSQIQRKKETDGAAAPKRGVRARCQNARSGEYGNAQCQ